jgi:hypothetical protein
MTLPVEDNAFHSLDRLTNRVSDQNQRFPNQGTPPIQEIPANGIRIVHIIGGYAANHSDRSSVKLSAVVVAHSLSLRKNRASHNSSEIIANDRVNVFQPRMNMETETNHIQTRQSETTGFRM